MKDTDTAVIGDKDIKQGAEKIGSVVAEHAKVKTATAIVSDNKIAVKVELNDGVKISNVLKGALNKLAKSALEEGQELAQLEMIENLVIEEKKETPATDEAPAATEENKIFFKRVNWRKVGKGSSYVAGAAALIAAGFGINMLVNND